MVVDSYVFILFIKFIVNAKENKGECVCALYNMLEIKTVKQVMLHRKKMEITN